VAPVGEVLVGERRRAEAERAAPTETTFAEPSPNMARTKAAPARETTTRRGRGATLLCLQEEEKRDP